MKSLVYLVACITVILATQEVDEIRTSTSDDRNLIVGGTDAQMNEYGWFTSIHKSNSQQGEDQQYLISGGQLISEEFVLTSAQPDIHIGDVVIIGQLCYEFYNCGQIRQRRKVAEIYTHPNYEIGFFPGVDNDFRLLKLDLPVVNIAPVKLDDGSNSSRYTQYKRLYVAGLGLMNKGMDLKADRLQELRVTYLPTDDCRIEKSPFKLGDSTMCTSLEIGVGNADRCIGDTGGPLYDKENRILVGLVSYGDSTCLSKSPSVYAKVSDKLEWIKSTVCSNTLIDSTICSQDFLPAVTSAPTNNWCDSGIVSEIEINTDSYPEESYFHLTDINSNRNYEEDFSLRNAGQNATIRGSLCLAKKNTSPCYRFEMIDIIGDGIGKDATDNDFCISVDRSKVHCSSNFNSHRESVLFPPDQCEQSCKPVRYTLNIQTQVTNLLIINIQDLQETLVIRPYALDFFNSETEYIFPLDLCTSPTTQYTFVVLNLFDALFQIKDEDGNIVISQDDIENPYSQYQQVKKFTVARSKKMGIEDRYGNMPETPTASASRSGTCILLPTIIIFCTIYMFL